MSQVDELLMAINTLVDNAPEWQKADIENQAEAIQRLAANLPRLVTQAKDEERERCAGVLGAEVMRLLGCRDREDAEGIARAAKLIRDSAFRAAIGELSALLAMATLPGSSVSTQIDKAKEIANKVYAKHGLGQIGTEVEPAPSHDEED